MNEKANCTDCGNVNEVKVSTGHNKPENKGRKYFTCANCGKFQWVNGDHDKSETVSSNISSEVEAAKTVFKEVDTMLLCNAANNATAWMNGSPLISEEAWKTKFEFIYKTLMDKKLGY